MICDVCKEQPAVYGDGSTWGRCSKCQYEFNKANPQQVPQQQPTPPQDGFKHKFTPGLTSIIMPIYMGSYPLFHYTGNAIGAVRAHSKRSDYELIVVDNGSPIKTPNLQSFYADKVIVNEGNKGVTYAWNQGIRASFGEYIVLINNDTQVYEHWLEDMKRCLDEGGLDLVMATPMYSLTEPFARWVESERERDKWKDKPITASFSNFKDFSCVMFKKSLVDELGTFDETFFNYASDSDLLRRMEEAGKRWASTMAVPIHHIIEATGSLLPETPKIMDQDKAKFEEKWSRPQVEVVEPAGEALGQGFSPADSTPSKGGALFRTDETGDAIFFLDSVETYHHIKNPDTLHALGFEFGDEVTITKEMMDRFKKGEDLSMDNVGENKSA